MGNILKKIKKVLPYAGRAAAAGIVTYGAAKALTWTSEQNIDNGLAEYAAVAALIAYPVYRFVKEKVHSKYSIKDIDQFYTIKPKAKGAMDEHIQGIYQDILSKKLIDPEKKDGLSELLNDLGDISNDTSNIYKVGFRYDQKSLVCVRAISPGLGTRKSKQFAFPNYVLQPEGKAGISYEQLEKSDQTVYNEKESNKQSIATQIVPGTKMRTEEPAKIETEEPAKERSGAKIGKNSKKERSGAIIGKSTEESVEEEQKKDEPKKELSKDELIAMGGMEKAAIEILTPEKPKTPETTSEAQKPDA